MNTLLGSKAGQTQRFLENGIRIPVTIVNVAGNTVISIKTKDKNGYSAIQLGFGTRKHPNKPMRGIIKGAKSDLVPRFLKEAKSDLADEKNVPEIGSVLAATELFKPGDIVDVTGVSKGKGFAGGVKRHHFKGGPRTHGQSDRERAPGSIGQTTTPGRVYKGKRMAGKMGSERATVKNLQVVEVFDDKVLIKGLVPGNIGNLVTIQKRREGKKFVQLFKENVEKKEEENAN